MNNRFEHIDIAKGIAMILVVGYHTKLYNATPELINIISFIMLPLFFFLSGVFFSYKYNLKEFLFKKSDTLLKPYFSVSIILVFFAIYKEGNLPINQILGVFYGVGDTILWDPMWFLTHLFLIYLFTYFLFRFAKFDSYHVSVQWLIISLLLIIGSYNIDMFWQIPISIFSHNFELTGLPFSMDIILITSSYFIAGKLLKNSIINFSTNQVIFYLCILILIFITIYSDAFIELNKRIFIEPLFSIVGSICGIYIIIYISFMLQSLKKTKYLFNLIGKSSLYILIFHGYIAHKTYDLLIKYTEEPIGMILVVLFTFTISIITSLLLMILIKKSYYLSLFFEPRKL